MCIEHVLQRILSHTLVSVIHLIYNDPDQMTILILA